MHKADSKHAFCTCHCTLCHHSYPPARTTTDCNASTQPPTPCPSRLRHIPPPPHRRPHQPVFSSLHFVARCKTFVELPRFPPSADRLPCAACCYEYKPSLSDSCVSELRVCSGRTAPVCVWCCLMTRRTTAQPTQTEYMEQTYRQWNLGSRTPLFTNKSVHEQIFRSKTSRLTNGVSDYEHASWQQRQAESIGAGVSVAA
jgi:hypothetical protein